MKLLIRNILFGIAWGCLWLVVMGVILYCANYPAFEAMTADYPRQALGGTLVGIACVVPVGLYKKRTVIRFLLHITIALGVFFPVAYTLHWIPYYPQHPGRTVLEVLISIGIFMAIWCIFFLINRHEAQQINRRMQELKKTGSPHKNTSDTAS